MDEPNLEVICFQLMDSLLDLKSAAYGAGPLDSGRLYYESLARGVSTTNIRNTNESHLTLFIHNLRRKLPYPVINPGLLRIDGWAGQDYGSFFLKVIESYVKEVWFIDGWEYSIGATKEFVFCLHNRVPCLDQAGNTLTADRGKQLIMNAASYIEGLGLNSSKLRSRIQYL